MMQNLEPQRPRVLVVGDVMLDRYTYGVADRVSPESPALVIRTTSREVRLGGAGNVAANCKALGAITTLASVVGADPEASIVRKLLQEQGLESWLAVDEERCTTVKERILGQSAHRTPQQVLRLDCESTENVSGAVEKSICDQLQTQIAAADLVLVADYGKGLCSDRVLKTLLSITAENRVPVFIDPARGADWTRYWGSTLIKPNRAELEAAAHQKIVTLVDAASAVSTLAEKYGIPQIVATLDRDGMMLHSRGNPPQTFECQAKQVSDVTGAGDSVFAVLGVCIAQGLPLPESVRLANLAGGIQVERTGATTVTWNDLQPAVKAHDFHAKVLNRDVLQRRCATLRSEGQRIVFTNGCFDLLHVGHVTYLEEAAKHGDVLIVGLNSDASVGRLKGPGRPIVDEGHRAKVVAALQCVNYVVIFEDDTPFTLLQQVRPDVLVKGGDYRVDQIVGRDFVESYGGRVAVAELIDGVSTTKIINAHKERCAQ